jgi:hypothetical protein
MKYEVGEVPITNAVARIERIKQEATHFARLSNLGMRV